MRKRNYKGVSCLCGIEVSIGSKSGRCKSCAMSNVEIKSIELTCQNCKESFNVYLSRASRKYCSKKCFDISLVGKKLPYERVKKSVDGHRGALSHFWKGGVTSKNRIIRGSFEYKQWREAVFKRDDYTCQHCGDRGVYLQADHIKPFALYPELRLDLNNGRTLCLPCHKETDTYLWKMRNYGTSPTAI